tara:strand:- start:81 stop:335 length:255 start_codon:yes stop_codon:yes gene_type:complete
MLDKFFIIVTMVTVNPELGTDLYAFKKPYDTKEVCVKNLELNYNKYFTAAYNNYKGKLSPDKAYCISGELLKQVFEGNIASNDI